MKRMFHAAVTAAAVWALSSAPMLAQSGAGSTAGSASGSGATDQAGSKPGGHSGGEGVTGTSPRGTEHQGGSTAGTAGQSTTDSKAKPADRTFIAKAAAGGLAEVKLGTLASEKASNADVKKFGEMMVTDHTKANDQLKQIASAQQVTPPADLKPQDQAVYDRLSKLSGEQFDRAYMRHMVEDHQKDVAEFQKASKTAGDPAVKQFATDTLPTLQKHLQDAKSVSAKLGGGPAATSGTKEHHATGAEGHHGTGTGTTSGTGTTTGQPATPPRPPSR
jgi:putative membrane protein